MLFEDTLGVFEGLRVPLLPGFAFSLLPSTGGSILCSPFSSSLLPDLRLAMVGAGDCFLLFPAISLLCDKDVGSKLPVFSASLLPDLALAWLSAADCVLPSPFTSLLLFVKEIVTDLPEMGSELPGLTTSLLLDLGLAWVDPSLTLLMGKALGMS